MTCMCADRRNSAILAAFDAERAKIDAMPQAERRAYCFDKLVRQGIYTADGVLTPEYGGPE